MSILQLQDVSFSYDGTVPVLSALSYSFEPGKLYAVTGYHGAGKSTLMYLLAGLADPTGGDVLYDGQNVRTIDRTVYRSRYVGTVLQGFNLLPQLSAVENIELTMNIAEMKIDDKQHFAMETLNRMGLGEIEAKQRVKKLQGISLLRAAVARALCFNPTILLLDEPVDTLDEESQRQALDFFRQLAHEENKCVILTTCLTEVIQNTDVLYELPVNMPVNKSPEPPAEEPAALTDNPQ